MEAMAFEDLIAAVWQEEGFAVRTRHPVRVERGYSDVDVLAVRGNGDVRIAEVKLRGRPRAVYCYAGDYDFVDGFLRGEGAGGKGWDWTGFVSNLSRLWGGDRPGLLPPKAQVRSLDVWFCGNLWFPSEQAKDRAHADLQRFLRAQLPPGLRRRTAAHVVTSLDIVLMAFRRVQTTVVAEKWGRRFGHPVLDVFRECVRYTNPQPHDGGKITDDIRAHSAARLTAALAGKGGQR